ncbi:MAG TPA: HAD hydrolase family protein [bacterium]|nr:HAD hydrolase family protein [bacterium]
MGIKDIKLLLTDVDGVLTNGKVYVGIREELVRFDIQDGIGHRLAAYGGLKVGWLSGRLSKPVALRAKRLKVPFLYQGQLDKLTVARDLCKKQGIPFSNLAYMGDDLIDIPLLRQAGWSATVPYGCPEVKKTVHYITRTPAGEGAFREVVEKILKAQGRWTEAVEKFHHTNGHKAAFSNDVFA